MTAGHFSLHRTLLAGICLSILGGLILLLAYFTGHINVPIFFISIFISFFGLPLSFANLAIAGISSHHDKANATSIFNFNFLIIGSIVTYLLKFLNINHILLLGASYIILMLISLFLYKILFHDIKAKI